MADALAEKSTAITHECCSCSSKSTSSLSSVNTRLSKETSCIAQHVIDSLASKGIIVRQDGLAIWSPQSALHPRNWSVERKCYDTGIIMCLEFLVTLVSNTGSSAAEQAYMSFGVSKKTALLYFTFAYLCGQAAGGLFLPPISETFGTKRIFVVTTALYGLANLLIAAFPSPPVIIVARLCAGFFSAAPGTVAAGSIENMWNVRARVWVVHLWVVTAVAGLACGPPVATIISLSALGWRWIFMILGLTSVTAAVFCLSLKESRPSTVLLRAIRAVEKQTDARGIYTSDSATASSFYTFCNTSLLLPPRLFFTEPIVALTSTMAASVYAIVYMFPEALQHVYPAFGFDTTQTSLCNLAIICGIPFTFVARLIDVSMSNQRRRHGRPSEPEDKLVGFIVAGPCLAMAFLVFALTVPPLQTHITFWASLACLAAFGYSAVEFDYVLSGYLTDSYSSWAASANAPMAFLRAMFSGIFPMFAGDMFGSLGANNATFILAGVATLYCVAAAWFVRYGRTYRARSKFATQIAQSSSSC